MSQPFYNQARVSQPGSVILRDWNAARSAQKAQANAVPASTIVRGTDMFDVLTGGLGASPAPVTERTAMNVAAVYACVALIGGAVASMPFHIYRKTAEGRQRYDSDLWWLFNESPFDGWTASAAWQWAVQSIALRGDGFWQIHRVSPFSNTIIGLEPLLPAQVDKGSRTRPTDPYPVADRATGAVRYVDPADMLHFGGVGYNGLVSLTPIQAALRPAAGIALAADQYAGDFFANGARPDFAIVSPKGFTKEQRDELRETWAQRHAGMGRSHLPAVLSGGLDIKELTMTAEDTQLLGVRNQQIADVARIFGVPPHMIGHNDKTTSWGSGVEQMSIGFVRYTVGRYLDSMTQEINRKIWPRSRQIYAEHARDSLLEGDSTASANYFGKALGGPGAQGWMTVNEVRRLKNLPPVDGGDRLMWAGRGEADAPAPKDPEDGQPGQEDDHE